MKNLIFILLYCSLSLIELFPQLNLKAKDLKVGASQSDPTSTTGMYVTSKGTIKSLAVFIQFLGDSSHSESTEWWINQAPSFLHTFLDSTETQVSIP